MCHSQTKQCCAEEVTAKALCGWRELTRAGFLFFLKSNLEIKICGLRRGCSLVVKFLPSMYEALSSIFSIANKRPENGCHRCCTWSFLIVFGNKLVWTAALEENMSFRVIQTLSSQAPDSCAFLLSELGYMMSPSQGFETLLFFLPDFWRAVCGQLLRCVWQILFLACH